MLPIPKTPTEETRSAAARVTAKTLIEEAEVEGDLEEIAADVAKHCRYHDGYQNAKALERAHWDCDMRIAEVLDHHSYNVDRAHEQVLADFQKEHDIKPPFPVGTVVKTKRGLGVIDGIYGHRAMSYLIKIDGEPKA